MSNADKEYLQGLLDSKKKSPWALPISLSSVLLVAAALVTIYVINTLVTSGQVATPIQNELQTMKQVQALRSEMEAEFKRLHASVAELQNTALTKAQIHAVVASESKVYDVKFQALAERVTRAEVGLEKLKAMSRTKDIGVE